MEVSDFKAMDLAQKVEYVNYVKNEIIGSHKQKNKYWEDGLIEVLLSNMDELEMSSELLLGAYSIFVCYTNNFEEAYDTFKYQDEFSEKIVDNLNKAMELCEDNRVIDLCMQIIRNLLVNDIISPEKASHLNIIKILEGLVDNNKRINLAAQIVSKLAKDSEDVKNQLLEDKKILDSLITCIENKGSNSFRISLLDCLINLSTDHDSITTYIRENINIQKLISLIKYQHKEINAKVAYLATILNSEKKISGEFENIVKQIVFQITRMLQSTEIDEIVEATTMLYNLVKSNEGINDVSVAKKSLCVHTCEVGAAEILSKFLGKYADDYIEYIRSAPKSKEEEKKDADMENAETTIVHGRIVKLVNKEAAVDDVTGNFLKTKTILMNILRTTQYLMNAHQSCMKKVIAVNIPHHMFKLLDRIVGDDLRICTWECLRILARAKKPLKIQIIEEDQDLEKVFKDLINDPNVAIQKLGLAIICNFSIDFPGMILTFKEFMPKMKDFVTQDEDIELKLYSIKTLKNLLYCGHSPDVRKNAEKVIFEWIPIKEIYILLDNPDPKIKEQAELIFTFLSKSSKNRNENSAESEGSRPKSVLDSIDDDMKARIAKINSNE